MQQLIDRLEKERETLCIKPKKRIQLPAWLQHRSRARSCASKHRYRDIEQAKRVRIYFPDQRIYYCLFCNGYHLTKRPLRR